MNIPLLDKRVRSLEEMMADLISVSTQTSIEMAAFKEEMREDRRSFKVEMREFKDKVDRTIEEGRVDRMNSRESMQKFQDEMAASRQRSDESMRKFEEQMEAGRISAKEEARLERDRSRGSMQKFQDEMESSRQRSDGSMRKFSEEMRLDRRELNKKLGEIANKQGRMTEDLVAPSICRILLEVLGLPSSYECSRTERTYWKHSRIKGKMKEFDVIAERGDYVMVTETKSSPDAKDVKDLLKTIGDFRDYFPERKDKKIIGCLATLYAHKSLIRYASRKGILVLAVGEELMDVMNEPGFKPTEF